MSGTKIEIWLPSRSQQTVVGRGAWALRLAELWVRGIATIDPPGPGDPTTLTSSERRGCPSRATTKSIRAIFRGGWSLPLVVEGVAP